MMLSAYRLFALISSILWTILLNSCQVPSSDSSPRTLVFVGDSFTAGDGVDKEKTFASLVGKALEADTSINRGRSGWPTTAYLRRWDEVQKKLPASSDMIFIQLGANDLRVDGHSSETVAACRKNMEEICRRIEQKFPQAKIILMSSVKIDPDSMIPMIREAGFGAHSNAFLEQIGDTYEELAAEKAYGFIDLIPHIPEHGTHDGAHLTVEGHQMVAKAVLEYLGKY